MGLNSRTRRDALMANDIGAHFPAPRFSSECSDCVCLQYIINLKQCTVSCTFGWSVGLGFRRFQSINGRQEHIRGSAPPNDDAVINLAKTPPYYLSPRRNRVILELFPGYISQKLLTHSPNRLDCARIVPILR